MSEFHCHVVQLGKVGKHPNADTLSITTVYGYPVIFKSGAYQQGDLAIRIPVDAVVDTAHPAFSWLADKAASNGLYRVRAGKIRGIPSYGFLVPTQFIPQEQATPGTDVVSLLPITKYDPGPCYQQDGVIAGDFFTSPEMNQVPHYDIEGLRKYQNLFAEGEEVWVSEKVHGSNGRWAHLGGQFLAGSRKKFRTNSVWNRIGEEYGLEAILSEPANQGLVLFGEVYGHGIQDLTYGADKPKAIFFDLYDTRTGRYWGCRTFRAWCERHSLPVVPTLFEGPFNLQQCFQLAEGQSTLPGANHLREGIVVKPIAERLDQEVGRVFLKLPGEGYLLRNGA